MKEKEIKFPAILTYNSLAIQFLKIHFHRVLKDRAKKSSKGGFCKNNIKSFCELVSFRLIYLFNVNFWDSNSVRPGKEASIAEKNSYVQVSEQSISTSTTASGEMHPGGK